MTDEEVGFEIFGNNKFDGLNLNFFNYVNKVKKYL